ncbi:MAG: DUF6149 family protein [Halobacteriaceae archaeon]
MKLRQTARHVAARRALEAPVVGDVVHDRLVDLHVRIFAERAPEDAREARRPHLEALFDGTVDAYLAALQEGFSEAEAREVTHVMANVDFHRHGWTEMLEFPPEEVDEHLARYADFFEEHGVSVDDPLGDFEPEDGLPDAPATPERLEGEASAPNAEGGYADDVYVEDEAA